MAQGCGSRNAYISTSATPTFSADVAGAYVATLSVNDGSVTSPFSTVTVTASVANAAPVANAGAAQNVLTGAVVTLNGSASTDANSDPLTYAWTLTSKPAGSTAALAGATSAAPTFTTDATGTYVVSLTVDDGIANSTASTVTVTATVANAAPVANAGAAQNVLTGAIVTLNGSASSDANGDTLTYSWTFTSKPLGSLASLSGASSATPTFSADMAGTYVASLLVSDGTLSSAAASVSTTATVANAAPVANAGATQNVLTGAVVTLNGSASSDANSDPLTYAWTLTSRPGGSSSALANGTTAFPTFTPDVAGTYVASLVVNDGQVSSAASAVTISVTVPFPAVITGNVYIQDFPFGPFNQVNLVSGVLTAMTSVTCGGISAAAVGPDGIALGTQSDGSVVKVDPVSGLCSPVFTAPEWLDAIAVASDGSIVAQSQATSFGAKQIYRFSTAGLQQLKVALSGVSSLGGIAFAPNGNVYGGGIFATNDVRWFQLDSATGVALVVAPGNQLALSEVCIDSAGIAYGHAFGVLYKYVAATGAPLGSLTLQRDMGLAPIICR